MAYIPDSIIERVHVPTPKALQLILKLCHLAGNESGECWHSQKSLADKMNKMRLDHYKKCEKELEQLDLITITPDQKRGRVIKIEGWIPASKRKQDSRAKNAPESPQPSMDSTPTSQTSVNQESDEGQIHQNLGNSPNFGDDISQNLGNSPEVGNPISQSLVKASQNSVNISQSSGEFPQNLVAHIGINSSSELQVLTPEVTSEREAPSPSAASIFAEFFGREPAIIQQEKLGIVSDLQVWRQVLDAWKTNLYSPRNLTGMIDAYRSAVIKPANFSDKRKADAFVGASESHRHRTGRPDQFRLPSAGGWPANPAAAGRIRPLSGPCRAAQRAGW